MEQQTSGAARILLALEAFRLENAAGLSEDSSGA
jgi:hypothetical protein